MKIEVYSDGSAQTKDKPGGWASVVLVNGKAHEISGHLESATNNDAELMAAIKGLELAESIISMEFMDPTLLYDVTLISDSEIVLNWANGSYRFKQLDKIHNYNRLMELIKKMNVKTRWVKGHGTDVYNNRCDKLANAARKGFVQKLDKSSANGDTKIGTKKSNVVCLWYAGHLKIIDFENDLIENYNRDVHGKRGSSIEIREEKSR